MIIGRTHRSRISYEVASRHAAEIVRPALTVRIVALACTLTVIVQQERLVPIVLCLPAVAIGLVRVWTPAGGSPTGENEAVGHRRWILGRWWDVTSALLVVAVAAWATVQLSASPDFSPSTARGDPAHRRRDPGLPGSVLVSAGPAAAAGRPSAAGRGRSARARVVDGGCAAGAVAAGRAGHGRRDRPTDARERTDDQGSGPDRTQRGRDDPDRGPGRAAERTRRAARQPLGESAAAGAGESGAADRLATAVRAGGRRQQPAAGDAQPGRSRGWTARPSRRPSVHCFVPWRWRSAPERT